MKSICLATGNKNPPLDASWLHRGFGVHGARCLFPGLLRKLVLFVRIVPVFLITMIPACQEEAPLPPPSITSAVYVSVREASWHASGVLRLQNKLSQPLNQLKVSFYAPDSRQELALQLDLPPASLKELGYIEGWALMPGEVVMLTHQDYRPASYEVFRSANGTTGIRQTDLVERMREPDKPSRWSMAVAIVFFLIFLYGLKSLWEKLRKRPTPPS
jgi:hypothetical protein